MLGPIQTLGQLFVHTVTYDRPDHLLAKRQDLYHPVSSVEFCRRVIRLHLALRSLGVRRGDCCALLSENRWEWLVADLAMATAGIISLPLDPAISGEELHYRLVNSGSGAIFISTRAQREKLADIRDRLPSLRSVITLEGGPGGPTTRIFSLSQLIGDAAVTEEERKEFQSSINAVQPGDPATITYASDEATRPEAVTLTHTDLVRTAVHNEPTIRLDDAILCFLPLHRLSVRTIAYGCYLHGASLAYAATTENTLSDFQQVMPTVVIADPGLFVDIRRQIVESTAGAPWVRRNLFQWAFRVGVGSTSYRLQNRPMPSLMRLRFALAQRLVFSEIRIRLGGRIRQFLCGGGGPLPRDLEEFFCGVDLPVPQLFDPAQSPILGLPASGSSAFNGPSPLGAVSSG